MQRVGGPAILWLAGEAKVKRKRTWRFLFVGCRFLFTCPLDLTLIQMSVKILQQQLQEKFEQMKIMSTTQNTHHHFPAKKKNIMYQKSVIE